MRNLRSFFFFFFITVIVLNVVMFRNELQAQTSKDELISQLQYMEKEQAQIAAGFGSGDISNAKLYRYIKTHLKHRKQLKYYSNLVNLNTWLLSEYDFLNEFSAAIDAYNNNTDLLIDECIEKGKKIWRSYLEYFYK